MRRSLGAFSAVALSLTALGVFFFLQNKTQPNVLQPEQEKEKQTITMLFVGDIMVDRGVEWQIRQHNADWAWPFRKIAETLQKADLAFGNLESVISDKGTRQGSIYSFRAEPESLQGLSFAGFDVLSVANNHSLDYGTPALVDTVQRLRKAGITPVGGGSNKKEAHAPAFVHIQNTVIAILSYTNVGSALWQAGDESPGIVWMDETKLHSLRQDILQAHEQADIVVVSFHFGDEYTPQPNATQRMLAKTAIDAGADLVIGHHPHVVQPVEHVCNLVTHICGWIAWSLGNFVFDQGFSKETMEGLLIEARVLEKKITEVIPRTIHINSFFQPELP